MHHFRRFFAPINQKCNYLFMFLKESDDMKGKKGTHSKNALGKWF